MNTHNVYLVFLKKIKKISNVAIDLEYDVMIIYNFFAHWIKELDIKRYGNDIPILPLTNTVKIDKYSDAILKHMEGDTSKTIQIDLLYSNKNVSFPTGRARRKHYTTQNADEVNRADAILDDRLENFSDQLKDEYYYMIPLRFLCYLGLVNQPVKFYKK